MTKRRPLSKGCCGAKLNAKHRASCRKMEKAKKFFNEGTGLENPVFGATVLPPAANDNVFYLPPSFKKPKLREILKEIQDVKHQLEIIIFLLIVILAFSVVIFLWPLSDLTLF